MDNSEIAFTISYDWPLLLDTLEKRSGSTVVVTFTVPTDQNMKNMLILGLDYYPLMEGQGYEPSHGLRKSLTVEQMYHFQHTMREVLFEQLMLYPEMR